MLILNEYEKERVLVARDLAKKFHYRQMYGKYPYLYHLDQVAYNAKILYNSDCQLKPAQFLAVAYLHDSLEDSQWAAVAEFDIQYIFGFNVLDHVRLLTHYPDDNYGQYLHKVEVVEDARLIKIADMIANTMECVATKNYSLLGKYKRYLPNLLLQ